MASYAYQKHTEYSWIVVPYEVRNYGIVIKEINRLSNFYAKSLGLKPEEYEGNSGMDRVMTDIIKVANDGMFCVSKNKIEELNQVLRDMWIYCSQESKIQIEHKNFDIEKVKKCLNNEKYKDIKNTILPMIEKHEKAQNLPKAVFSSGGFIDDASNNDDSISQEDGAVSLSGEKGCEE